MKYRVPYIHTTTVKNDPFNKKMKVERLTFKQSEKIKDDNFQQMMEGIGDHKDQFE